MELIYLWHYYHKHDLIFSFMKLTVALICESIISINEILYKNSYYNFLFNFWTFKTFLNNIEGGAFCIYGRVKNGFCIKKCQNVRKSDIFSKIWLELVELLFHLQNLTIGHETLNLIAWLHRWKSSF